MSLYYEALPYAPDAADWFGAIADQPWSMALDGAGRGPFDVLVWRPERTLRTRGASTEVAGPEGIRHDPRDPFTVVDEIVRGLGSAYPLARPFGANVALELGLGWGSQCAVSPGGEDGARLPFYAGAVGYLAYDLGRRLERLPAVSQDLEGMPELALGIYRHAVCLDHGRRRAALVGLGQPSDLIRAEAAEMAARSARPGAAGLAATSPLTWHTSRAEYGEQFRQIKAHIRAGDCYQVNLSQRFSAGVAGNPWTGYRRLRGLSPAPFAAYLHLPDGCVLSSSPERFLACDGRGRIEARPIKGTRPRHRDPSADRQLAEELAVSPKDRAENVMIVDLLRNDLARSCRPGSVWVPRLCEVETHANVHHLVSTVEGQLAPGRSALMAVREAFPGGSITGAPKIRAMEIIERCEPVRRGVYCGAIGFIGVDGRLDLNIAIRTLVAGSGTLRGWAGGGIVADSAEEAEYRETLDKASAMLKVFTP